MVDKATVRRWLGERDRTLFLCDIRTEEEFRAGSLQGAQHTPGGQLVQATDEFIGVRNARIVLFDSDGVRAPTTATWLKQMGWDVSVLREGIDADLDIPIRARSEEHTSELQSLMRISYAVFCLKKKKNNK